MIPSDVPVATEPVYVTAAPNDPVVFYRGPMVLRQSTTEVQVEGKVFFRWFPRTGIRFEAETPAIVTAVELGEATLKLPDGCILQCDISNQSLTGGIGPYSRWAGRFDALRIFSSGDLHCVVFHVPNLSKWNGQGIRDTECMRWWNGRVSLCYRGWVINIDDILPDATRKQFKESGGYAISAVGSITREDGSPFAPADAELILDSLSFFLSFARGLHTSPLFAVGFNGDRARIWERWVNGKVLPYYYAETWFNEDNPEDLARCFDGFAALFLNPSWNTVLKTAITWYLEANARDINIESGLCLVQAALEMLAWTILVRDKGILSEDGFSKISAADKIRLLLTHFRIPTGLTQLAALKAVAAALNWMDGPQAVTEIRNAVMHGSEKKRDRISAADFPARVEAWELCLSYLELLILALCGFNAHYVNRLRKGCMRQQAIESVPWAVHP